MRGAGEKLDLWNMTAVDIRWVERRASCSCLMSVVAARGRVRHRDYLPCEGGGGEGGFCHSYLVWGILLKQSCANE